MSSERDLLDQLRAKISSLPEGDDLRSALIAHADQWEHQLEIREGSIPTRPDDVADIQSNDVVVMHVASGDCLRVPKETEAWARQRLLAAHPRPFLFPTRMTPPIAATWRTRSEASADVIATHARSRASSRTRRTRTT